MPTKEELEQAKSPRGGYTRATLAAWGISWPPLKGWRKRLLKGIPEPTPEIDPDALPAHDSPAFDSAQHGLLKPPKATYRRLY
ncbi:hypothetical protein [Hymenobacter negativus]|uniref:hypothetical protein n=1 Tax=Hymenobacter negativus TaxID=2795026 RepID=UPI001AAFCF26|nr:hypothetical protein [Hymenobacter negativus]